MTLAVGSAFSMVVSAISPPSARALMVAMPGVVSAVKMMRRRPSSYVPVGNVVSPAGHRQLTHERAGFADDLAQVVDEHQVEFNRVRAVGPDGANLAVIELDSRRPPEPGHVGARMKP